MRRKTYSIYEAKSKLSQAVREAGEGYRVVVTVHGREAVELKPIKPLEARETLEERMARLIREGQVTSAELPVDRRKSFPTIARRPGALKRFLKSRD